MAAETKRLCILRGISDWRQSVAFFDWQNTNNMKNKITILYDKINNIETQEQTKKELWNNVVFDEFNKIYEELKPTKKDSQVEETSQVAETTNKAGQVWNKRHKGFYFHNDKIYFIELCPDLSMPTVHFRQYDITNFLKGINELNKKKSKLLATFIRHKI